MPCYNVEKYIADAIESVLAQTFTNWELRIVDDCSTDSTYAIAQKYAQKDSRIHVSRLMKNSGGCHIPRNKAVLESSGEWIHCLDADDYIDAFCLEKLLERCDKTGAGCVLQPSQSITDDGVIINDKLPKEGFNYEQILTGDETCRLTLGHWDVNLNGCLYNKKLYIEAIHDNQVPYSGPHADELTGRFFLWKTETVAFCDTTYWRRTNPTSITRQLSLRRFGFLPSYRYLSNEVSLRYASDVIIQTNMERMFMDGFRGLAVLYLRNFCNVSCNERKEIFSLLRKYFTTIDLKILNKELGLMRLFYSSIYLYLLILLLCLIRQKIKTVIQ